MDQSMIETLKPPTDSLYKFLAIFCLVVFITSITAPFVYDNRIIEQQIEYLRDADILVADAEDWKQAGAEMQRANERMEAEHKQLMEAVDKRLKGQLSAAEVQQAFDEEAKARSDFRESSKVLRQKASEWEKKKAEVEYKGNLLDNSKDNARAIRRVSMLGAIVSLILS